MLHARHEESHEILDQQDGDFCAARLKYLLYE